MILYNVMNVKSPKPKMRLRLRHRDLVQNVYFNYNLVVSISLANYSNLFVVDLILYSRFVIDGRKLLIGSRPRIIPYIC